MSKALLLCLLVATALTVARAEVCPPGLEGHDCHLCQADDIGDLACANLTQVDGAWCYSNHTWSEGSMYKVYGCTTENTDFASSVSDVWAQCYADVQKCDLHFALGGYGISCGGLSCTFDGPSVHCSYTKCSCDGTCPSVGGVSLGYMLERLTGKTSIACEEDWPYGLCTFAIDGLSSATNGFQAYCKVGECRTW